MAAFVYERVEGFPQIRETKDGKSATDKVWSTWDGARTAGVTYAIGSVCPFDDSLMLDSFDIQRTRDGDRGFVTLNYLPLGTGTDLIVDSNRIETSAESVGSQEPLDSLPATKYRMKWNHTLIKKIGAIDYTGYDSPINELPMAGTYPDNKWIQFDEQCPDGWVVQVDGGNIRRAIKPGIRTYIAAQPIFHETKIYSDVKKLGQALLNVGKTTSTMPKQTFGLGRTSTRNSEGVSRPTFLITGVSVQREWRKWVLKTDYQYSDSGWDSDIYTAV